MNTLLGQQLDQVKAMVKEPEYEHGTLMARVCGVDVARNLHRKTKKYTENLGYVFDYKSGHWSLREDVVHAAE